MGIQNDAGEILIYIYEKKIKGEEIPSLNKIVSDTAWEQDKVIFALEYLLGKSLIDGKAVKTLSSTKTQVFIVKGITPFGIDVIENKKEFQKHLN